MSTLAALAVKRREEIAARQAAAAPPGTLATGRPAARPAAGPSRQLLAPARELPRSDGPTRETSLIVICACGHSRGTHPGEAACAFHGCPCTAFVFRPALPVELAGASLPSAHARRAKPRRQANAPRHRQAAL